MQAEVNGKIIELSEAGWLNNLEEWSEELAVEAIKWGAADYIVKDWKFLDLMPTVVEQVLDQSRVWEEKRVAEEALRRSQATQAAILDAIPDGLMQLDGEAVEGRAPFARQVRFGFADVLVQRHQAALDIHVLDDDVVAVQARGCAGLLQQLVEQLRLEAVAAADQRQVVRLGDGHDRADHR